MVDALEGVVGVAIIVLVVGDAIGTLLVTQGRSGRIRPTRLWYTGTWRLTRWVARRLPASLGQSTLNLYPALSLLGLLVLWLAALTVGWSLLYSGIGVREAGSRDFGSILYLAGSTLVTPAGEISKHEVPRLLSLVETLTGVGTIALLISYLPALYGAYSRREAKLLTLDDPAGLRIAPITVISVAVNSGGMDGMYRTFAEWETWTAEILESHVSYPMLALFRSQHRGQSWISALGVVQDAATLSCACVEGADVREAYFMYRRGERAITEIAGRLDVPRRPVEEWLSRDLFEIAWGRLVDLELPLVDKEAAWQRLQELRRPYTSDLERLIDFLEAPHGFWGHSAEAIVAMEVAEAEERAQRRR